jgi:hypothetical protein
MQLAAPITHVTVFPDRALIQRRGSATLAAGAQSLVIGGLPATLERDSLRAAGRGPVGSRIERVDAAPEYHPVAPEATINALQAAIEDLERQLHLLQARQQALRNQQSWLSSLGEHAATDLARGLAFNRLRPEDCGAFFTFAADQARMLNEAEIDLQRQHEQLQRDLQAKQRELAQLNGLRSPDRLAATVEVTLPEPGAFTLDLSYIVPGASWTPQYDVRVDTDHREVTLAYQGLVRQHTGEDWQQVALTLSTARPSLAARVPDLEPWYLHAYAPPAPTPLAHAAMDAAASMPAGPIRQPRLAAMPMAAAAVPAEIATTAVEEAGAALFQSEAYVGATKLEKIASGEEFQLFVGIDDRIRVKRDLREKEVDKGSILQSNIRRITYTYRTEIHNYLPTPERITLRDRLPVPQHERVKVRALDIRPQPDERTKLDLLTWEFVLQPDQERVFEIRFSVEHPADMVVTNMP